MKTAVRILLAFSVLPYTLALAQSSATETTGADEIYGTQTASATASPSSKETNGADDNHDPVGGLAGNYYLVFLALVVCLAALAALLVWRRKRRVAAMYGRGGVLQRDASAWDSSRPRRRYWEDRWAAEETGRQEGLNEHGEAPPPYIPKGRDEEDVQIMNGPAVPLQALSREQAGLKPPDYDEAGAHGLDRSDLPATNTGTTNTQSQARQQP